ncbi:MAG: EamA family transporter [Candidatus Acidiferrum sp.]|jgi:drug/metabolite transporter (DMT)-like permease
MRTVILFFLIIASGTGGELCVSRAMRSMGEVHDFSPQSILNFVLRGLRLPWMWVGVAMMSVGFFSLLAILSFRDVSFVVPVSALSYAAGAFGARAFLGERISRNRWLGIAVVCVGVTIVWWSGR